MSDIRIFRACVQSDQQRIMMGRHFPGLMEFSSVAFGDRIHGVAAFIYNQMFPSSIFALRECSCA